MLKKWLRKILPNPFDQQLKKARKKQQKTFLIVWNRGLGDIALGLYAMVYRIRQYIPDSSITFITRQNLALGFKLLSNVDIIIAPDWKRKEKIDLASTLAILGRSLKEWDVVIESADPTYWVRWQLGKLTPTLLWDSKWDSLSHSFALGSDKEYVGVHIQTETSYGYEKNWPQEKFEALFLKILANQKKKILLFGVGSSQSFPYEGIIDLRGKTDTLELLSVIKNFCSHLLVPDSGIFSLSYFIDEQFPLKVISLWADPHQGVLKQNVASPNKELEHKPLIAPSFDLNKIDIETVYTALFS